MNTDLDLSFAKPEAIVGAGRDGLLDQDSPPRGFRLLRTPGTGAPHPRQHDGDGPFRTGLGHRPGEHVGGRSGVRHPVGLRQRQRLIVPHLEMVVGGRKGDPPGGRLLPFLRPLGPKPRPGPGWFGLENRDRAEQGLRDEDGAGKNAGSCESGTRTASKPPVEASSPTMPQGPGTKPVGM